MKNVLASWRYPAAGRTASSVSLVKSIGTYVTWDGSAPSRCFFTSWVAGWSASKTRRCAISRIRWARQSKPAPRITTCSTPWRSASPRQSSMYRVRTDTVPRGPDQGPSTSDHGMRAPDGRADQGQAGEAQRGPEAPAEKPRGEGVVEEPRRRRAGRLDGSIEANERGRVAHAPHGTPTKRRRAAA